MAGLRGPRRVAAAVSSRWRALPFATPVSSWVGAVTGNGWAAIVAICVALGLIAWGGWVEAGVLVVVIGLCLVIAVLSVVGRSRNTVQVLLPQTRTTVGTTAIGELRVGNPRSTPVRTGIVELPAALPDGESVAQFVYPGLAAGAEWAEVFAIPARRRGVIVLGPPRTVRTDGLGLLRKVHQWAQPVRLYVNPLTIRVEFDAAGFQTDVEGVTTARLSHSDVSFHALRDYAPGDDRRYVHWPTSARTGRLVVRQFEETRRSHHLILLDTASRSWSGEDFEVGVSVAASLARTGMSKGRKVSLATSTGWITTSSPAKMLDDFSELEVTDDAPELAHRIRKAVADRPATSVLTVVTGARWRPEEYGRWAVLAGGDLITGVVVICPGQPPRRLTVGRARVAMCPTLQDLPRVLVSDR